VNAGKPVQVSVIGAGSCGEELEKIAERIGELLAEKGCIIVNGGRGGVMEAVSRGASRKGGIVVGVLPDRSEGNPYLTVRLKTNLGHARNVIIAQSGDVVIAVGGSYGTISEMAIALKEGKKVVAVKPPVVLKGVTIAETAEEAVEKALNTLKALLEKGENC